MINGPSMRGVHDLLLGHHGAQAWWPADGPFEVMVGAILTQNTSWSNVERGIEALKERDWLSPEPLLERSHAEVAEIIRPVGYFNVKTRRLKAFCAWYLAAGGYATLQEWTTPALRAALLSVKGVGRETADDILLYAFHRPVFVIDAYTRRLFTRLGCVPPEARSGGYEHWRALFEEALEPDPALFNEYHALIVKQAKDICRPRPLCGQCVLAPHCRYAASDDSGKTALGRGN